MMGITNYLSKYIGATIFHSFFLFLSSFFFCFLWLWVDLPFQYLWLQEQAKKAVESALGGKKTEFDKWDEEIKKRAEASGGGEGGGGGWFGWGGGGFNGDHFWQEVQHTSFAILGVIFMVRNFSAFLL